MNPSSHSDHTTTTNGDRGRDPRGRFTKGNPGGPGNPFYRRQAAFRRTVQAAFTPEDAVSVLNKMRDLALEGDVAAAKVFLEYVIGKPTEAPDPDREAQHAWELREQSPRTAKLLEVMADGILAEQAEECASRVMPAVAAGHLKVFDKQGTRATPPASRPEQSTDETVDKRRSASGEQMSCAVRTVADGDNGDEKCNGSRRDAETTAVFNGEIGDNRSATRSQIDGETGKCIVTAHDSE